MMDISPRIKRYKLLICIFLAIATLAAFWQVQHNDFISYDDEVYVTENPYVKNGLTWKNIGWALTATVATNWHPITWLSHMLDYELYGLNPSGHHLTSLLIHIANTILLFLVFSRMTGALWKSSFVAALFALHPLHVESVAWVAERKDVLCTFFWIMSLWAYGQYVRRRGVINYFWLILFYTLGLMTKPMLVTLPFVLLLFDYWPMARFASPGLRRQMPGDRNLMALIWEKIPLFILSAISSAITIFAQQAGGAVASLDSIPFKIRAVNAFISYLRYLGKMIWPRKLAVFYPYQDWPIEYAFMAGLLMVGTTVVIIRAARSHPYLLTGWFWYLGTLFPVIGLVHAGSQSIADRYTYIPLIGIFIMVTWGISNVSKLLRHRNIVLVLLSTVVLVACMICSWFQVRYWQNTATLFNHALNVTRNNGVAYLNLGYDLHKQGRLNDAMNYYSKSLEVDPYAQNAHNNIGFILAEQGKVTQAIDHYHAELRLFPKNANAHNNLANALFRQGQMVDAALHYREALRINPDHKNAHYNFGNLLLSQGDLEDAMTHTAEAIRIDPDFSAAYNQIGVILYRQKKIKKAKVFFLKAIQIHPAYTRARKNLKALEVPVQNLGNIKP
jgi:Flp pilus assembly protein TadD